MKKTWKIWVLLRLLWVVINSYAASISSFVIKSGETKLPCSLIPNATITANNRLFVI